MVISNSYVTNYQRLTHEYPMMPVDIPYNIIQPWIMAGWINNGFFASFAGVCSWFCRLSAGAWAMRNQNSLVWFSWDNLNRKPRFSLSNIEKILVSSPLKPIQQIWRIHTLQVQLEVPLCRASMRPFNLRWVLSGVPWASPSWDEALRRQRQRPHQTSRDVYCI